MTKSTDPQSKHTLPCVYGRLLIREFTADDRETLLEFTRHPDLLKYMLFSLANEKEVDELLDLAMTAAARKDRMEWHLALEEKDHPGFIGSVALMREKEAPSSAELGYWFKQEAWGKGYATEASRFILELGFKTVGLHRIWGKCHIDNRVSARVMEKLGMKLEGTVREHVWMRDHYRSSYLYSLLEPEYKG